MSANTQAAQNAAARWNAGDLDGYLQLYAPSIQVHGLGPQPLNREELAGFYQMVWAAFPGSTLTFHDVLESAGDRLTVRFNMTGDHNGNFMGVPATGNAVTLDGISILQMRDGRCIERWTSADMLGLLQQLGAVPAPA